MKKEMADCLTLWTASLSTPFNLCCDETTFTDDEGKEVTSLLDDLAEAKRHISTDDVDNDADADGISLWDDVCAEEQWTTKDSNSGPTLAELNGGELTDLEQYEPLQIVTKRKRSRSGANDPFHRSARSLMVPVQMSDVNTEALSLQTVQPTSDSSVTVEAELQHDKESSASLTEQQVVKGTLSPSKPNRKVYQKFVQDTQLRKSVSLPYQQREDSCTSANHSHHALPSSSKHSRKLEASESAFEFRASKKMKTHHRGLYLLFKFRLQDWGVTDSVIPNQRNPALFPKSEICRRSKIIQVQVGDL